MFERNDTAISVSSCILASPSQNSEPLQTTSAYTSSDELLLVSQITVTEIQKTQSFGRIHLHSSLLALAAPRFAATQTIFSPQSSAPDRDGRWRRLIQDFVYIIV